MNTITTIQEAREFATIAHNGQKRKTSGRPYITHPELVAKILEDAGMSVPTIIAAFNHDVVEDTHFTIEDLGEIFEEDALSLIAFNTEDKTKTWEERKNHTIEQLKTATIEQKALVVADKFANLIELIKDSKEIGEEKVFSSFKRGKSEQHWYFKSVGLSAMENLESHEIPYFFNDYLDAVKSFFEKENI